MSWWTFSHGLAFGIGGLVARAVMLISGWRYCDGRCDMCGICVLGVIAALAAKLWRDG